MKTNQNYCAIFALLFINCMICSCTSTDKKETNENVKKAVPTRKDSIERSWDQMFNSSNKAVPDFFGPVEEDFATICVKAYDSLYNKNRPLNTTKILNAFTISTSFGSKELEKYILQLYFLTNYNQLRICFGVYTDQALAAIRDNKNLTDAEKKKYDLIKGKKLLGRLTVFLWPYKDESPAVYKYTRGFRAKKPVQAFNLGELKP